MLQPISVVFLRFMQNWGNLEFFYSLCMCFMLLLTHSMQQSPSWEANSFSTSQEIPRIL